MRTSVLVSGLFNVLHPGHLRLLRFARECGTELIVAVDSDRLAGSSAHVKESLRLEGVKSIGWVNRAFIVDEPISTLIARERPDVVVKGKEYEQRFNPEQAEVEQYGGILVFSSGESFFSSLDLIQREFQNLEAKTIILPHEFLVRHEITTANLISRLNQFSSLRVCVVGDLIVDEYITCEPLGMSQEEPTIVVAPIESKSFIGGAGIVAAHAAGLGASVRLVSVAGADATHDFALNGILAAGVTANVLIDAQRPTTLKQRYRSHGKSLLRVSRLHQGSVSLKLQQQIFDVIEKAIEELDLLVFADFNYGCLPQSLVDRIIVLAKRNKVRVVADSQSSSQLGDISRFKMVDLLTPTEHEARIATRNQEGGLVVLAEQLRQQTGVDNILLKLGEEGLLIHCGDGGGAWETDRVPALNRAAKDVAGAGDSLLIASAMTLTCGGAIWEAAALGSLAAAIQVGRVGNTPLSVKEMTAELS